MGMLAGGAAAAAALYGAHHVSHGHHHYGMFGHHGKFKHGKFGKRWKHGHMFGRHKFKKWKWIPHLVCLLPSWNLLDHLIILYFRRVIVLIFIFHISSVLKYLQLIVICCVEKNITISYNYYETEVYTYFWCARELGHLISTNKRPCMYIKL